MAAQGGEAVTMDTTALAVVVCDGRGCENEFVGRLEESFTDALSRSGYETVDDDTHFCEDCYARLERAREQEATNDEG